MILFIFLYSCSPVNYIKSENVENIAKDPKETISEEEIAYETNQTTETEETTQNNLYDSIFLKKEILIILPNKEKSKAKFRINSIYGISLAVEKGAGLASLPDYMVADKPHLIRVLPNLEGPSYQKMFFSFFLPHMKKKSFHW